MSGEIALQGFGFTAVAVMIAAYVGDGRIAHAPLVFAIASLAAASYAVLTEAWLFAGLEVVWAGFALRRWRTFLGR